MSIESFNPRLYKTSAISSTPPPSLAAASMANFLTNPILLSLSSMVRIRHFAMYAAESLVISAGSLISLLQLRPEFSSCRHHSQHPRLRMSLRFHLPHHQPHPARPRAWDSELPSSRTAF